MKRRTPTNRFIRFESHTCCLPCIPVKSQNIQTNTLDSRYHKHRYLQVDYYASYVKIKINAMQPNTLDLLAALYTPFFRRDHTCFSKAFPYALAPWSNGEDLRAAHTNLPYTLTVSPCLTPCVPRFTLWDLSQIMRAAWLVVGIAGVVWIAAGAIPTHWTSDLASGKGDASTTSSAYYSLSAPVFGKQHWFRWLWLWTKAGGSWPCGTCIGSISTWNQIWSRKAKSNTAQESQTNVKSGGVLPTQGSASLLNLNDILLLFCCHLFTLCYGVDVGNIILPHWHYRSFVLWGNFTQLALESDLQSSLSHTSDR